MPERLEERENLVAFLAALVLLELGELLDGVLETVEMEAEVVFGREVRNDGELGAANDDDVDEGAAQGDEVLVCDFRVVGSVEVDVAGLGERKSVSEGGGRREKERTP